MPTASIAASCRYFTRFSGSKAGLLGPFWQERADEPDLVLQMRVLTVIKSEKIARGPFQSGSALVHTARTQGHLPGSPSQEASRRDRSAPQALAKFVSALVFCKARNGLSGVEQPGSSSGS